MEKKVVVIIQARTGSTRLENKVMHEIEGKTVLEHVIDRMCQCQTVDEVVVATTLEKRDLEIVKICAQLGVRVYCGAEEDVLDRYYQAAKLVKAESIVRITADCPMHDWRIVDEIVNIYLEKGVDYASNTIRPTYPDGIDAEVFKFSALQKAWREAKMSSDREHVTQYLIRSKEISKYSVENEVDYADERWTLDTAEDEVFIREVYAKLYEKNPYFGMEEVVQILEKHPELRKINKEYKRNEGLEKSLKNNKEVIFE